ncbi:MAG TPA: hypothetical protein VGC66_05770 [Pyrinomonadaceae bacterium]
MALVIGLGTPATFADGTAESPGIRSTTTTETTIARDEASGGTTVSADGTAESPGIKGVAESPGIMATFLIYLDVII